jgi:cytoskeletal protein RodZ
MIFTAKKIPGIETLGEKLRQHRETSGLSRAKAARLANISVSYIEKLENNAYGSMPADIYAINIIKSYAELLRLNPAMVADLYQKEKILFLKTRARKAQLVIGRLGRILNNFLNPRTLKYLITLSLLAAVLAYIGLEASKITAPPEVQIFSPEDNLVTTESQITIQGKTDKEVSVLVNNRPLLSDQAGNFSLALDLQKGLNIIKISASKKHSKETIIYKKIIVEEPNQ